MNGQVSPSQNTPGITLNPFQMLQITDITLKQLGHWIDTKNAPNDFPKHNITAKTSIHHTRLLLGVKLRELAMAAQAAEKTKRDQAIKGIPPSLIVPMKAAEVMREKMPIVNIDHFYKEAGLDRYIEVKSPPQLSPSTQ